LIDEEMSHLMDIEDRKSKGLIGETYSKLIEIIDSKERAQSCLVQANTYIDQVNAMVKSFEAQAREDVTHVQVRIDRLKKLINNVDVALMKNDVQGKINDNLKRANSPTIALDDEEASKINLEEIDMELIKS
jgi:hypothetical protein